MSCPTCDHTMHVISHLATVKTSWCPRCGTIRREDGGRVEDTEPGVIERCRRFEKTLGNGSPAFDSWHRIGVRESINLPSNR